MTIHLRLLARADDEQLAGLVFVPFPAQEGDPVVALGDVPAPEADLHLRTSGPCDGARRVVAPIGAGCWRRAPWPARDDLFDEPAPRHGDRTLVSGGTAAVRRELSAELRGAGAEVDETQRLTRADLLAAATVVLPEAPGSALPALAPAVLASGRLLVTFRAEATFGLLAGSDHLQGDTTRELVELALAAARFPYAFTGMRALARAIAERHRASRVYRRLLDDLAAERS